MTYRTPENTPLFDVAHPTPQQVFDAAVRHAAQMPGPSRTPDSMGCLYRTKDKTNACFIGGLVTDDEAVRMDRGDDDTGIATLLDNRPERVPDRLSGGELRPVLIALQHVHDDHLDPQEWPFGLRRLARDQLLDDAVVNEVFPTS